MNLWAAGILGFMAGVTFFSVGLAVVVSSILIRWWRNEEDAK